MDVLQEYLLTQEFGGKKYKPNYQLLTWQESDLIAGVQTVTIPLAKSADTLYIRLEQIAISTDGLGGTVSFRDTRYNTNLFTINNNVSFFTVTKFPYLVNNTSLTIVTNSPGVLFSIGYCRISKIDLK